MSFHLQLQYHSYSVGMIRPTCWSRTDKLLLFWHNSTCCPLDGEYTTAFIYISPIKCIRYIFHVSICLPVNRHIWESERSVQSSWLNDGLMYIWPAPNTILSNCICWFYVVRELQMVVQHYNVASKQETLHLCWSAVYDRDKSCLSAVVTSAVDAII